MPGLLDTESSEQKPALSNIFERDVCEKLNGDRRPGFSGEPVV